MGQESPVCQQMHETILEMFKNNVPKRKIERDIDISPFMVHNIITGLRNLEEFHCSKGKDASLS